MNTNQRYTEIFLSPLKECSGYRPKFGHSKTDGYSLEQFLDLYGRDPFYNWIGLDSPYMFAAHKAAGGMTSIYRQIGIGCERLFRTIITDCASYHDESNAQWSYTTKSKSGKEKTLFLDAFIDFDNIQNTVFKENVQKWAAEFIRQHNLKRKNIRGIVFEVRQGYKSKDSKRQNADLDNATVAYANDLIPVFAIFSSQIDDDVVLRYQNNKCGVLTGVLNPNPYLSIYSFCKNVLSFDLEQFFKCNSDVIRKEIQGILKQLLFVGQ